MNKLCIFCVKGSKTQRENSLITQQCMSIILLIHEQMFNDHMTLILSPIFGHYHFLYAYIYQNFVYVSSLLKISDHDVASTTLKLNCLKLKCLKLVPSQLQLLVILVLVIIILHLLCLHLLMTFLVTILMLIIVFLLLPLGYNC